MICSFEYVCQLLFSFKIFLKSINNAIQHNDASIVILLKMSLKATS